MFISNSRSLKELIEPFSLNKPVNPEVEPTHIDQFVDRVKGLSRVKIGELFYAVQWAEPVRQLTLKAEPHSLECVSSDLHYEGEEQLGLKWDFTKKKWTVSHSLSTEGELLDSEFVDRMPNEEETRDLIARFRTMMVNLRTTDAEPELIVTHPFGFDLGYLQFPYETGVLRVDPISAVSRVSVHENKQVPGRGFSARDKWVMNFKKRPQRPDDHMTVQFLRSLDVTKSYPAERCSNQKGS